MKNMVWSIKIKADGNLNLSIVSEERIIREYIFGKIAILHDVIGGDGFLFRRMLINDVVSDCI